MSEPAPPTAVGREGVRAWRVTGGALDMALADDLAALEHGRRRMRAHLDPLELGPRTINRVEVVFEEVVGNILRHGFATGVGQTILVRVAAGPDGVELTFEDDGAPFDPLSEPEPPPFESLATARVGGLGIAVVRGFAASLAYELSPPTALAADVAGPGYRPVNRLTVAIARQP